ncbi:NAD(P)H-binding protein [Nocardiopsis sp. RSe5-2]|uniref:NAD(P)H-binding protein n=1 Tax=Nocardiopsis endophytica TaxID=3018445 RepID=A0ABT4TYG1_9ACTN|nr:NAD(P)H-binding protein [Nocardiopsis endophytica]MDA2809732.1 NAD(P)H-binding protein [Nocardiopsis endophytica]
MTNDESTLSTGGDILVLAATGKTGRRVVRRLREAGAPVRAASRSSEVAFDWTDPGTWGAALDGVRAVYLVAPEDPAPIGDFVAQAVKAGVGRFAVLSGHGIEHTGPDFGQGMVAAEEAAQASGAAWTIIRPNNFFQNFTEDLWLEPVRSGRLALPIGAVPEPFVDAEDVAAVAVAALTEDGHDGQVYELSGPRAITFAEAARAIGEAAGREVRFEELTPEQYHDELVGQGFPEELATALNAMFALHRDGHSADVVDGVQRALGRPATDFHEWVLRTAETGVWA